MSRTLKHPVRYNSDKLDRLTNELIPGRRLGREVRRLVRVGGGRGGVFGLAGILLGVLLLLGVGVVGRERGQSRHSATSKFEKSTF